MVLAMKTNLSIAMDAGLLRRFVIFYAVKGLAEANFSNGTCFWHNAYMKL